VATRPVTLEVSGQILKLRTDTSDEKLEEIVHRVDQKVDMVRAGSPHVPASHLYLLAALLIAEDLEHALQEVDALRAEVAQFARDVLAELDESVV